MAAALSESKPRQFQLARLRREEDEETWISGEELHTEGSSDDDASGIKDHHHLCVSKSAHHSLERRISAPAHFQSLLLPPTASEPVLEIEPHLTETTRRLSQMGMEGGANLDKPVASPARRKSEETHRRRQDQYDEQEEVMLWRPKRGSIKLPDLQLHAELAAQSTG